MRDIMNSVSCLPTSNIINNSNINKPFGKHVREQEQIDKLYKLIARTKGISNKPKRNKKKTKKSKNK